jgi:hypothetical protein
MKRKSNPNRSPSSTSSLSTDPLERTMFQGRAGKLLYKFIIPVPFLSNPQGLFLGALFDQLSTPHILLSRAPKKERKPGFPKSQ